MKKAYRKLALLSHPYKKNHPQVSAVMRMITESMEGSEDSFRYNYAMSEQEEDIQCQEEAWREDEIIRKAKEESEVQKKKAEINVCMNMEQQVS